MYFLDEPMHLSYFFFTCFLYTKENPIYVFPEKKLRGFILISAFMYL
jgi:hypothetical protein